ncbi:MAG: phosphoribosylanthranilate isomerase [Armatimonadota bacterium]|nr:phosphoribosylanthranilate isomerase [bacterium]
MTLVKVCGITSVEDALACADMGADMLGFVFAESPRRANASIVKGIVEALEGRVGTVGVFTEESDEVFKILDECRLDYAQLHGGQSEEFVSKIGAERVIRVARIKDEGSVDALGEFNSAAFYLLDTYKKGQAGGTGETFDWDLAVRAKRLGKLIILSGGLKPENVGDAIRAVRPYAIDVSSGVEACPGKKDLSKVKELIKNVREADDIAG